MNDIPGTREALTPEPGFVLVDQSTYMLSRKRSHIGRAEAWLADADARRANALNTQDPSVASDLIDDADILEMASEEFGALNTPEQRDRFVNPNRSVSTDRAQGVVDCGEEVRSAPAFSKGIVFFKRATERYAQSVSHELESRADFDTEDEAMLHITKSLRNARALAGLEAPLEDNPVAIESAFAQRVTIAGREAIVVANSGNANVLFVSADGIQMLQPHTPGLQRVEDYPQRKAHLAEERPPGLFYLDQDDVQDDFALVPVSADFLRSGVGDLGDESNAVLTERYKPAVEIFARIDIDSVEKPAEELAKAFMVQALGDTDVTVVPTVYRRRGTERQAQAEPTTTADTAAPAETAVSGLVTVDGFDDRVSLLDADARPPEQLHMPNRVYDIKSESRISNPKRRDLVVETFGLAEREESARGQYARDLEHFSALFDAAQTDAEKLQLLNMNRTLYPGLYPSALEGGYGVVGLTDEEGDDGNPLDSPSLTHNVQGYMSDFENKLQFDTAEEAGQALANDLVSLRFFYEQVASNGAGVSYAFFREAVIDGRQAIVMARKGSANIIYTADDGTVRPLFDTQEDPAPEKFINHNFVTNVLRPGQEEDVASNSQEDGAPAPVPIHVIFLDDEELPANFALSAVSDSMTQDESGWPLSAEQVQRQYAKVTSVFEMPGQEKAAHIGYMLGDADPVQNDDRTSVTVVFSKAS